MRLGVVCGLTRKPQGVEVVVRLNREQYFVATVDPISIEAWDLKVGQAVQIDPGTIALSVHRKLPEAGLPRGQEHLN